MKDRDCEPRLQVIVGTGGSESDPCWSPQRRARIRISTTFAFTRDDERAGALLELRRPTMSDRFPGGDAA